MERNAGHTPSEYVGKICPYCKTPFVEGDEIVQCSACEMPHHKDCWIENQGCTTFGCQGTIRGLDGQSYSQMMAEGAQKAAAPQQTMAYQRPVYGQSGYTFTGQSQAAERPTFGAQSAYGGMAGQGAGKICPNCGAQNISNSIFCARCGARMAQADAPAEQSMAGQAPVQSIPAGQDSAQPASAVANPAEPSISAQTTSQQSTAAPSQPSQAEQAQQDAAAGAPAPAQTQAPSQAERLCPACGASNPPGAAFCYQCGARFEKKPEKAQEQGIFCLHCGARNPANAAFCYGCGQKLYRPDAQFSNIPSGQAAKPGGVDAAHPYDAIKKQGQPKVDVVYYESTQKQGSSANAAVAGALQSFMQAAVLAGIGSVCPKCGTGNPPQAVFCQKCGSKLGSDGEKQIDPARPYDAIKKQGQPRADAAHPYDAIKKQGSSRAQSQSTAPQSAAPQSASANAAGVVCARCGTRNASGALFCQECGSKLGPGGEKQVDPARPYDAIKKQGSGSSSVQPRPYSGIPGQGANRPSYAYAQTASPASAPRAAGSGYAAPAPAPGTYRAASPALGTYRSAADAHLQSLAATPQTPEEFAAERRLFLQKNEIYYEKKFAELQSGQLAWNWAAFCFSSLWLIYRRMYLWGYLTLLGQLILAAILFYAWPVAPLLMCILLGMFGNNIYKSHVEKEMKRVQRLSKMNRQIEYADKGGVRLAHPIITGVAAGIILMGINASLFG